MAYCEQCGARLKSNALFCEKCGEPTLRCSKCGAGIRPEMHFCENCGAPAPKPESESVSESASESNSAEQSEHQRSATSRPASTRENPQEMPLDDEDKWSFGSLFSIFSSQKTFTLFQEKNWKQQWESAAKKARNQELCIIMTDEAKLLAQMGCTQKELRTVLKDYLDAIRDHGVSYYYLDLAENAVCGKTDSEDVDKIVDVLKTISMTARPKYLFILGDNTIVNVAIWDNMAGDSDPYVKSDLPYCTLSTDSPWDKSKFNYAKMIRTSRLPTIKNGLQAFKAYFANAAKGIGHAGMPCASGVSAEVWKAESAYEFKRISGNKIETSPVTTKENLLAKVDRDKTNVYFFNLHGSDSAKYWYGQRGYIYPECVQPSFFENAEKPCFIGVEACYGGRYIDLEPSESILRTAMANNCLSMLASSEIAYGTSMPEGSCADLIVGEYLAKIKNGATAGDAYVAGLVRLMKEDPDDAEIKTLAEFSLYGDPSACMGINPNLASAKVMLSEVPKGIDVPIPDVLGPLRLLEAKIDRKLEQAIDRFVTKNYLPDLSSEMKKDSMHVKSFRIDRLGLMERMYFMNHQTVPQIVKVYFNEKGDIHRTYVSK